MQSVAESPPSSRYFLVTARYSPKGVATIRAWVETRVASFAGRPLEREPIERFLDAKLDAHVVLKTLYAYADVPVGEVYHCAFSLLDRSPPETASLVLDHAILEFGVPVNSVEHGWKHVLAFRSEAALPPVLRALPVVDDIATTRPDVLAGVCSSRDWGAIRTAVR